MSKNDTIIISACIILSLGFFACPFALAAIGGGTGDARLRIHLPRQVTISGSDFTLGQVGIVCGTQSLVPRASQIPLGRICVPGQEIIVDRSLILSRLASNGIKSSQVVLTGAQQTLVRSRNQIIKGSELVELARSALMEKLAGGSVCRIEAVRVPEELPLPADTNDLKLSARLVSTGRTNRPRVRIEVLGDGRPIAAREVVFGLKYNRRRAVALVDIPAGATITSRNVKIETVPSNYPEPRNWSPPYGGIAKRLIPAKTEIVPHMIEQAKPRAIVKRNETVVLRLETPELLITAVGKALQNGSAGDLIKVRNIDSKMIIWARVNEDGTVQPIF